MKELSRYKGDEIDELISDFSESLRSYTENASFDPRFLVRFMNQLLTVNGQKLEFDEETGQFVNYSTIAG